MEKEDKEKVFQNYILVGVDPGTTIALAFFDLNFNFCGKWSKKNAKIEEVIKEITNKGKPLLLITDVNKVPSFVLKLSDKFLIDYWVPNKNLSLKYKRDLVFSFLEKNNIKIHINQHELDAIAAVLNYLKINKRKIEYLKSKYGNKAIDLIKYGFIKEVKEEKDGQIKETRLIKKITEDKKDAETIFELKKEITNKERFIKKLKEENKRLRTKINKLWNKINKIIKIKEKEIEKRFYENLKKKERIIKLQNKKIEDFEYILNKLEKNEFVILYDFSLYKLENPSFISNKDLERINKEELKKFKYLIKEKDLKKYWKFGKIIVADKKEVENLIMPKEDEKKKIIEFFKIYKEQRKVDFLKKSSIVIPFILFIAVFFVTTITFYNYIFPISYKKEINNKKKEIAYKTLRNGIALLSIYEPVEVYLDYPVYTKDFNNFYKNIITIPFCKEEIIKGHLKLYFNSRKRCIEVKG